MAQLIPIVSEALQATVRRLLPSQTGFGEDLQAQNVIVPIIDLTPTAEGSILPANLQTAINFGGATAFSVSDSSASVATTPGFWRITGGATCFPDGTTSNQTSLQITDGLTSKIVWAYEAPVGANGGLGGIAVDLTVFLNAGESLTIANNSLRGRFKGSVRQVATVTGELVNPVGFVSQ